MGSKLIEGFPDYRVTSCGKVVSFKKSSVGLVLSEVLNKNGYVYINLRDSEGKRHHKTLHRLVADSWVNKESNSFTEVNHIDHDKTNNMASNLEWCDSGANKRAYRIFTNKKRGVQYSPRKNKHNPYTAKFSTEGLPTINLGCKPTEEEALELYKETYTEWFGVAPWKER
jgi:hypothetical protein